MDAEREVAGFSFSDFVTFTEDLENYCNACSNMMDLSLLHSIRDTFRYTTISLSHYPDHRFNDIKIIGNLSSTEATEKYLRGFQKRDPYAAHIGQSYQRDPCLSMLQSSEAFPVNYFNSEYYRFLRDYGVSWALTMPVGPYRLTVYKHEDENDFGPGEKEKLRLLGVLLRTRYNTMQQIQEQKTSIKVQADLLDSLDIGVVNANYRMTVTNCNQAAANVLKQVGCNNNIQYCFERVCDLLRSKGVRKQSVNPYISMEYMGYRIAMEMVEGNSEQGRVYSVTMLRTAQAGNLSVSGYVSDRLGLSERELAVGQMLVNGKSYQETADALFISINTVRTHIRNIYKKTGIKNQRLLGLLLRGQSVDTQLD